jgi:tetratricopeptide (TPR) repeat protein
MVLCGLLFVSGCGRTAGGKPDPDRGLRRGDAVDAEEPALKNADAYAVRASIWLENGDYDNALKDYDEAIRLKPEHASFLNSRGFTWHMKGIQDRDRPACEDHALADYDEAIRLSPRYASAINNRAWIYATSKVDRCRNGKLAVEEARKACELTSWKNPGYIDTLSVAYGEVGEFEQAIRWQKKALEDPGYEKEDGDEARKKLVLFAKRQPFRE